MMLRWERKTARSLFLCNRKLQLDSKRTPKMVVDFTVSYLRSLISQVHDGCLFRQKRMCLVLFVLICKLLFDDHSSIDLSSLLSSVLLVLLLYFVQGDISVLSSEYLIIEQVSSVACKSSVNIENMFGPPTVPCEHPV